MTTGRTITPATVNPNDLPAHRAQGWVEFHPETYCHRCGTRNIDWFVQRELWEAANGDAFGGGVLCPQCFVELYEAHIGKGCIWEVRLWGVEGHMDPLTVTPLLERIAELEALLPSNEESDQG